MGILSEVFSGLAGIGGEMTRQITGGKIRKSRGGGGSRPIVIRNYRISHNHYHLQRRRKKNPFTELYKAIKEKD